MNLFKKSNDSKQENNKEREDMSQKVEVIEPKIRYRTAEFQLLKDEKFDMVSFSKLILFMKAQGYEIQSNTEIDCDEYYACFNHVEDWERTVTVRQGEYAHGISIKDVCMDNATILFELILQIINGEDVKSEC